MRVKTVIKRTIIGVVILFVAIFVFGIILQLTGYQPPEKPEQPRPVTEAPKEQADDAAEPQAPPPTVAEEANTLPVDIQVQKPVAPLFDSVKKFRTAFNKAASMNNFNFRLPNLKVQNGEANNVFQCKITDNLILMGTVEKTKNRVKEISMLGRSDGTLESTTNLILCMAVIMASADSSLSPEQRGGVLRELGILDADSAAIMELSAKTEKNGLEYFINISPMIGIVFGVSRK
jgi:hypothetical protein